MLATFGGLPDATWGLIGLVPLGTAKPGTLVGAGTGHLTGAGQPLQVTIEPARHPYYGKDVGKVTSKLQVTVPKAIADRYGIRPGDELDWLAADDAIRVVPRRRRPRVGRAPRADDRARRLRLFDLATARQERRQAEAAPGPAAPAGRGWTRGDLYDRGGAD